MSTLLRQKAEVGTPTQPGLPSIHSIISGALRPEATHAEVNALVNLCHKAAIAYLRPKAAVYRHLMDGLTLEEVAFDAIADLFERKSGAGFPKFARWLERDTAVDEMAESTLWVEFRRIVFGAVNHHVFRLFRHADPSLARTLRNIKIALKAHPDLELRSINGALTIALNAHQRERRSLPEIPPERLEAELQSRRVPRNSIRLMLEALARVLLEETDYRESVHLTVAALVFRSRLSADPVSEATPPAFGEISEDEIVRMIDGTLVRLRPDAFHTYLRTSKLDLGVLESHLKAVREVLVSSIEMNSECAMTYFQALQKHLPGLTPDCYETRDRQILEYLAKQARTKLKAVLLKDLGICEQSCIATTDEKRCGVKGPNFCNEPTTLF